MVALRALSNVSAIGDPGYQVRFCELVMSEKEKQGRFKVRLDDDLSSMRFEYDSVSPSIAKFLRGQADRIRRQCSTSTIQIGRALLEAKRHLSHGEFIRWVEWEVSIPARTAQAYMRVASWAAGKGATVARLPPSALYLLSASNTPEQLVSSILSRAEAGEYVAPCVIREELKALRMRMNEQQDRPAKEISALRAKERDSIQRAIPGESRSGGGLTELVSILIDRLSPADFARVWDIMTSDALIGDPQLALHLERAFEDVMQTCTGWRDVQLHSAIGI
jgi:hypothetical protein